MRYATLYECCGAIMRTKGLLSMIDMKIAEYVKHAFHAGMLRQAVGSASAYPLLVAGSVGLFGASVVMNEAQQGSHASTDLYY